MDDLLINYYQEDEIKYKATEIKGKIIVHEFKLKENPGYPKKRYYIIKEKQFNKKKHKLVCTLMDFCLHFWYEKNNSDKDIAEKFNITKWEARKLTDVIFSERLIPSKEYLELK
jgi:hypothetical protein